MDAYHLSPAFFVTETMVTSVYSWSLWSDDNVVQIALLLPLSTLFPIS